MRKFLRFSIITVLVLICTTFFAFGISGPTDVCVGTNNTYTVSGSSVNSGYTWTIPSNATIISGTGTKSITIRFNSGAFGNHLGVIGNGVSESYNINAYLTPSSSGPISGRTTVCPGESGVIYSLNPNGNATGYSWTPPTGTSIASQSGNTITLNFQGSFTSGILYGRGIFGPCGQGPLISLTITSGGTMPEAAGSIYGPTAIYTKIPTQLLGRTYSVAPILNAQSYNWIIPSGASIASQNANNITLNFTSTFSGGTISVQGVSGSCFVGSSSSLNITAQTVLPPTTPSQITYLTSDQVPNPDTRDITTKPVGSLPCSVNVGSSGAASYSIPIITPPGTAGMQPNISINYNSSAGIGLLGKGWDLSSVSAITRTGNNFYIDGKTDGINFDLNDKYALDGNRIISINGTYGSDGTEYRTEYETFFKINSVGVVNNGGGYFIVETKDGKTMEYGRTLDSRLEAQSRNDVIVWRLNKVTDKFGNYITYNYTKYYDLGISVLSSIEYTGNDANSLLPYNKVMFNYVTKDDPSITYLKGSQTTGSIALQNISILCENTLVRQYIFNYNSSINEATRLVEVIQYAGNGTAYNSTIINWGTKPTSYPIVSSNAKPSYQYVKEVYGDFNGDGRLDWIQGGFLYLADQTGSNFTQVTSGTSSTNEYKVGDFNGDGLDDLLECTFDGVSTYTYTPMFSNGSGFTRMTSGQFTYSGPNEVVVGDFNGDGLADCFVKELNVNNQLKNWKIYSCTGTTHDAFQQIYSGNDFPYKNDSTNYNPVYRSDGTIDHYTLGAFYPIYTELNNTFLDFDGDGKTDLMSIEPTGTTFYKFNGTHFVKAFSTTDLTNKTNLVSIGDFNNDGNIDILISGSPYKVIYTTGYGTVTNNVSTMPSSATVLGTGDFNGDGKTDILYLAYEGGQFNYYVIYNIDNRFNEPVKIASSNGYSYTSHIGDFNGDGTDDFYYYDGSDQKNHMILLNNAKDNQFVKSITNGLNLKTVFAYAPITNTGIYTKGTGTVFPVMDYQGPGYVVSSVKSDNGIGGQSETDYFYSGLKIHRQGKGMLGFAKITTIDVAASIQVENTSDYNRQFYYPYLVKSISKTTDGSQISVTDYTNDVKDFTNKRIFPFVSQLVSNNVLESITQTSTFQYDDYGNQTSSVTNHGGEGTTTVTSTYVNAGAWCHSKPDASTITKVLGTEAPYTRTINYTYNANGQIITATTDPTTAKWVTTTYEYNNPFGLPTKATITGADVTGSRFTSYEYDTKARFTTKETNSLGQYTMATYYNETGNRGTSTDINGLQTTYGYDVFGRLNLTTLPDGNTISVLLNWKDSNAPANSLYSTLSQASGSAPVKIYYDRLGRTLRQVNKGFDGTDIYTDKTYNMLGQVYQSSDPYFSTAQPEWTTYSYDPYGRNKSVNAPTGNVTMAYNTRSVTTTNTSASPQQVFTKTINALGMLISSVDAGGTVSYAYYSSGKPKNITSPGSVVTSMLYDSWGNQTQLMEPNAGTIGYTYDAFHQLLTQSKNGVASSLTYDGLGRLKTLVETEGTTTYTYDTKTNGKGLLAGISAPGGVSGDYNYDSYCRLLSKTETIDGLNFTESLQYDSYGRLLTLTYPSAFGITYNYNNNYYLSEIKRTDNNASIWKAQVMNARGQIEQYTLGNGLITAQTFDHGFVTGIQTGSVQNLQYNWDKTTGNLTWRKDATRNLTENFSYDNLSRLTGITGNTTASYTFAANGNIATGTAAGTYTYNATKLHAVASVTNPLGSISSTDQIIQYTSFDKVKLITEGAKTVNLYYGADKERRKMVYNDGTNTLTRYYAHGNYEKESGTNNRELFYITAGTGVAAIYEKKAAGNQMYYISKDHLGSVNVITNESGAVVEEMSFDAWGRRRNPVNWTIRVFRQPMLSTVATPVMNTSTSLELLI